jgi:hypothetical protein
MPRKSGRLGGLAGSVVEYVKLYRIYITSFPANRKTRRAGKFTIIISLKCANLTVYIY